MRHQKRETLLPLALLAAATGARTTAGVAALAPRIPTRLLAAGELAVDKIPSVPNRIAPGLLLGRVAAGALVGFMVGNRTGNDRTESALFGGLIAFASTYATYGMRRALMKRVRPVTAAFIEDAMVVSAAAAGAAMIRPARR